jgi:hypothetical protein
MPLSGGAAPQGRRRTKSSGIARPTKPEDATGKKAQTIDASAGPQHDLTVSAFLYIINSF